MGEGCEGRCRRPRAQGCGLLPHPPPPPALLLLQGKSVVRLKGGCPSTFSRVSSEAAALAAAGLAFEMMPGVSSATAAPVLAGEHKP